jgi:hypothetical protein
MFIVVFMLILFCDYARSALLVAGSRPMLKGMLFGFLIVGQMRSRILAIKLRAALPRGNFCRSAINGVFS